MLQFLQNNAFGVFSLLAGFLVSYAFYRRSRRFKALSSVHTSAVLFSGREAGDLSKLEIFYDGTAIKNIARTRLLVWNSGTEVIGDDVFVRSAPLGIILNPKEKGGPEPQILDCVIQTISRESSACTAKISDNRNEIFLGFDYLEPKEGFAIDIIHTQKASFEFTGALKGVNLKRKLRSLDEVDPTYSSWTRTNELMNPPYASWAHRILEAFLFLNGAIVVAAAFTIAIGLWRGSGACSQVIPNCQLPPAKVDFVISFASHFSPFWGWVISALIFFLGLVLIAGLLFQAFGNRIPRNLVKVFRNQ